MTTPYVGLVINDVASTPLPVAAGDFSTVGLVVTAPAADAAKYPINTPVLISSSNTQAITDLGATGTAAQQVNLIDAQLGVNSARIVIIRVDEGADEAATLANVEAGVAFLEDASTMLGVTPRLIGAPGFTHQHTAPAGNVVVAALGAILERLRGVSVVTGPTDTLVNFTAWRTTVGGRRFIPNHMNVVTSDGEVDAAGVLLGAMVAADAGNSGRPSRSIASRTAQGIIGVGRNIRFNYEDGSTEGQQVLAQQGAIIVRGQAGSGGFTILAFDTAATDEAWRQYTAVRTRDFMHQRLVDTGLQYIGRRLTLANIQSVRNVMEELISDMRANDDIIDGRITYEAANNTAGDLRAGIFRIGFEQEETPILRRLEVSSSRFEQAFDTLISDILAAA